MVVQNNWGSNATAQLKLISPTDEFQLIKYASGPAHIALSNTSDIKFYIGGSEKFRLHSGGVVQIQDSTGTTQGNAQLLVRKGAGANAAPETVTRANSYVHLGGTEWGNNAAGVYALSFGYTNGTTGTNVPSYIGFKETTTTSYTMGDLVFGVKGGSSDVATTERLRITSGGVIQTGTNTITGGNNLAIQNFVVKGVYSGSGSIGKSIEMISGYDGSVKMAAIGYNLTDTNTGSTYGGDLTIHTQPLYSSPTTPLPVRMRVSSSGYVTKPNQPYCDVTLDTSRNCGSRGVHRFSDSGGFGGHYFTNVRNNVGSHYNSSNSRFTVPVTGAYLITMNIALSSSNPDAYLAFEWYRNGSRGFYGGWQRSESSGYHRVTSSTIWHLTKGDYLEPSFESDATVQFMGGTASQSRYTGFSIMLLA